MLRRGLLAVLGAGLVLGLAACAPASGGVPGSVAPGKVIVLEPAGPVSGDPSRAVDGAFAIGTGPVVIDAWVDFFCPYCRMFEEGNGEYIRALIDRGTATLRVHPIAILDHASMGTKYSTRAANAFACVAEYAPGRALDYMEHLYKVQPRESTPGLSDEELGAAAPADAVECIHGGWYTGWVGDWTGGALDAGVRGTPTVLVNGALYQGRLEGPDFREFVGGANSTARA